VAIIINLYSEFKFVKYDFCYDFLIEYNMVTAIKTIKPGTAFVAFAILGFLFGCLGVVAGGVWITFLILGFSWTVSGVAYFFADREITDAGFSVAFFLGIVGALLWLLVDLSRTQEVRHN
jgi:hypothetical protein